MLRTHVSVDEKINQENQDDEEDQESSDEEDQESSGYDQDTDDEEYQPENNVDIQSVDHKNWLKAIKEEKDCLKKNHTWDLVDPQEANGQEIVTSRWLESIYLYFPPSSQLLYLWFCPVGLSLL